MGKTEVSQLYWKYLTPTFVVNSRRL
jgi:hypothetical protein